MHPYRAGGYIKPKRINETQFEGHILYYNHRYQLKDQMIRMNKDTEFPRAEDAPLDNKIYMTAHYGTLDNKLTITVGEVNKFEKDEYGLKIFFTVTNNEILELFASRYLLGYFDIKILSKFDQIETDDLVVKTWPINQLFIFNIPFYPELN